MLVVVVVVVPLPHFFFFFLHSHWKDEPLWFGELPQTRSSSLILLLDSLPRLTEVKESPWLKSVAGIQVYTHQFIGSFPPAAVNWKKTSTWDNYYLNSKLREKLNSSRSPKRFCICRFPHSELQAKLNHTANKDLLNFFQRFCYLFLYNIIKFHLEATRRKHHGPAASYKSTKVKKIKERGELVQLFIISYGNIS